jgi:hypothetical protein
VPRRLQNLLASLLCLVTWAAWAAPADDGQTAGARAWVLFQARSAVAVTPSDSTDLSPTPTRGIIGWLTAATTCNIALRGADDGTTATTIPVAVGQIMWIEAKRILCPASAPIRQIG